MFFSSFFFLWEAIGKSLEEVERRIHMVIREGSMEFTLRCSHDLSLLGRFEWNWLGLREKGGALMLRLGRSESINAA